MAGTNNRPGQAAEGNRREVTDPEPTEGRRDDSYAMGRRDCLRLGVATVTGAALAGVSGVAASSLPTYPGDPSPSESEIGGGQAYENRVSRDEATYLVDTKAELLDALDDAGSGDVVYVENSARIDLTGEAPLYMNDGATLASGRGAGGARGGLLYVRDYPRWLFKIYGDNVRVSGLRIRGPRMDYFDPGDYGPYVACGLYFPGADSEVDNCQLYGWPHAALSIGGRHRAVSGHVHHCSIHNNPMEGLGYGVNLYNGHSLIEYNYFNMNRHSIDGFGYPTNGYVARYNLVDSETVSHAFDMHRLDENIDGAREVAGGTIYIHNNTFRFTEDILGRGQEGVTIRGVPDDRVDLEKNWFYHDERPDDVNVGENGQAYRQNNLDRDEWTRFYSTGNHFGRTEPAPDIGHPRDSHSYEQRTARALTAPSDSHGKRSAVGFDYTNRFDQQLTITDVRLAPVSDYVAALSDPSYGEGLWTSEVVVEADVRDGVTDLGGGVSLPASIDLSSDGHGDSPDTEPVFSAGSTGTVYLYEFLTGDDSPVDMVGEGVNVGLGYRLADGTTGVARFRLAPEAASSPDADPSGSLGYRDDARAVNAPTDEHDERSGVTFGVANEYDQRLTITDVGLTPLSDHVAALSDPSYGEGKWTSEIVVEADIQDGVTDLGGGVSLPASIDLSSDGHSDSPDTEPVLSDGSSATFTLYEFRDADARPIGMAGEGLIVELGYRLADGTTDVTEFRVTPTGPAASDALRYRDDARAVDAPADDDGHRAAVTFSVANESADRLTVTDVVLTPASDRVAALSDPSYGEGLWTSEVVTQADVQDGVTDLGGGVALPTAIDLDSEGHSDSPDTEPVLSDGSSATFTLYEFRDADDQPVEMVGEDVTVELGYRLADGTTGTTAFRVTPDAPAGLTYRSDARAVNAPVAEHDERSAVVFGVGNDFDQELTVTDVGLTPDSEYVEVLSDPSYGEGLWTSEVVVEADVRDGVTDLGGGVALPVSIDLSSDGHGDSPDTEPVLSANSTGTFHLYQFERDDGTPVDMVGETLTVELGYRLADGTTGVTRFAVTPRDG